MLSENLMKLLSKTVTVLVVTAAGFGLAVAATGAPTTAVARPAETLKGFVSRIVDGDTIDVRIGTKSDRIRVLGIDTPERGRCFSNQATAETKRLALTKRVQLVTDPSQALRDRYGRLLAYVVLPGSHDVGQALVAGGFARVYVYNNKPFARVAVYRHAETSAKAAKKGLWRTCVAAGTVPTATPVTPPAPAATATTPATTATTLPTTTTAPGTTATTTKPATTTTAATTTTTTQPGTTTSGGCAASYPTVCFPPPPPDLDCGQIPQTNFTVLWNVPNPDPHGFDGDKDGIGCETNTPPPPPTTTTTATTTTATTTAPTTTTTPLPSNCSPSYPGVCIPPPPPDLDCGDIPYRNFTVLQPDPHRFDGDKDGIGCES